MRGVFFIGKRRHLFNIIDPAQIGFDAPDDPGQCQRPVNFIPILPQRFPFRDNRVLYRPTPPFAFGLHSGNHVPFEDAEEIPQPVFLPLYGNSQ